MSAVEARKIASTPLSERLNLMTFYHSAPLNINTLSDAFAPRVVGRVGLGYFNSC